MLVSSPYTLTLPQPSGALVLYSTLFKTLIRLDGAAARAWQAGEAEAVFNHPRLTGLSNVFLVPEHSDSFALAYHYLLNPPGQPKTLYATVVVTMQCNMSCSYCHELGQLGALRMKKETAIKVGAFLRKRAEQGRYARIMLYFYGGEPLMNMDAIETVAAAVGTLDGKPPEIMIPTNGLLVKESTLDRLLALGGKLSLQITIDGPPEVHDSRRRWGKRSSFAQVMSAVKQAVARGVLVTVRTNVDKENADQVLPLLDVLTAHGLLPDRIRWYASPVAPVIDGPIVVNSSVLSQDEWEEVLTVLWQEKRARGLPFTEEALSHGLCGIPRKSVITIDSQGGLHPCTGLHSRTSKPPGTLADDAVPWQTSPPDTFAEDCRECAYFPYCGGGCSAIDGAEAPSCSHSCPAPSLARLLPVYVRYRYGLV